MKKVIFVLSVLFVFLSCSIQPYFMSLNEDEIGLSRVELLYGKGRYFLFNAQYPITKEELDNDFQDFYEVAAKEIAKQNICDNKYLIIKQSISYYDEGGAVSVLIKCNPNQRGQSH